MSHAATYNGRRYQLSRAMLRYCRHILAQRGRDFSRCEQCGESNRLAENRGLV